MDLDELERLLREATAGPWIEMLMHPYLFANPRGPQPWHHDIVGRFDYHSDANRALIAALRNHAEELIRDARRWRDLDLSGIVHDAVLRALNEAGVRNEVLRGMCLEVAIEKAQDAIAQEQP